MPEFSESFFQSIYEKQLLITNFCEIFTEAGASGVGYCDFSMIVLCAIIVST